MILKSKIQNTSVSLYSDLRDDKRSQLPRQEDYFPPLPKIYSVKKIKYKGFIVEPGKLKCSCSPDKEINGFVDFCPHLTDILLTDFHSALDKLSIKSLTLCKQNHNFCFNIVKNENSLNFCMLKVQSFKIITIFDIRNVDRLYDYDLSEHVWIFKRRPIDFKRLEILLNKLIDN